MAFLTLPPLRPLHLTDVERRALAGAAQRRLSWVCIPLPSPTKCVFKTRTHTGVMRRAIRLPCRRRGQATALRLTFNPPPSFGPSSRKVMDVANAAAPHLMMVETVWLPVLPPCPIMRGTKKLLRRAEGREGREGNGGGRPQGVHARQTLQMWQREQIDRQSHNPDAIISRPSSEPVASHPPPTADALAKGSIMVAAGAIDTGLGERGFPAQWEVPCACLCAPCQCGRQCGTAPIVEEVTNQGTPTIPKCMRGGGRVKL
jgi:hypothetical protein